MKTFLFILTIWNADGTASRFVADYNLTGEDCIQHITYYAEQYPGYPFGEPSCMVEWP